MHIHEHVSFNNNFTLANDFSIADIFELQIHERANWAVCECMTSQLGGLSSRSRCVRGQFGFRGCMTSQLGGLSLRSHHHTRGPIGPFASSPFSDLTCC